MMTWNRTHQYSVTNWFAPTRHHLAVVVVTTCSTFYFCLNDSCQLYIQFVSLSCVAQVRTERNVVALHRFALIGHFGGRRGRWLASDAAGSERPNGDDRYAQANISVLKALSAFAKTDQVPKRRQVLRAKRTHRKSLWQWLLVGVVGSAYNPGIPFAVSFDFSHDTRKRLKWHVTWDIIAVKMHLRSTFCPVRVRDFETHKRP